MAALRLERGKYLISKTIENRLDRTGPLSVTGDGATIIMAGSGPTVA